MSRYSLDLLLQVRALHERMARRRLADAATVQTVAETETRDLEEALADLSLPRDARTIEWVAAQASRRSMATLVTVAREHAVLAAGRTAEARDAWVVAERDRESIERLVARERAARDEERTRAEQRENDDLTTGRHARRTEPLETTGGPA